MNEKLKLSGFAKYAWFVLAYNIIVILWGAFLRASLSGDGCGEYWLTCGGEVVPTAPQFKTVIEFSHRLSTGLSFLVVLLLFVWAVRKFAKGDWVRKMAFASFAFIVVEALIGAGLVLTGNTAGNWNTSRPFWTMAHLITTFSLLAVLTLTAWFAGGGKPFTFQAPRRILIFLTIAVAGIFLIGMSGSIAALNTMLLPSASLSEEFAKDFAESSHILQRLRISHPVLSISVGIYLVFLATWLKAQAKENLQINRWANVLSILILIQFPSGAVTLLLHAPILMQIIHLLLADLLWIAFILLSANVLAQQSAAEKSLFATEFQSAVN